MLQHLSPNSGVPKDFIELRTVIPWAGTRRMGQNHTFNGSQGTKRRQKEKGLQEEFGETAQSNQIAFYDSRDCLPSTFQRTRREPGRGLRFCSLPYPRRLLCLHCASSTPTRNSLPSRFPSETSPDPSTGQPLAGRSPSQVDAGARRGGGARAGARPRPRRSHAPAARSGRTPRRAPGLAEDGHRGIAGGAETLIYFIYIYMYLYTNMHLFPYPPPAAGTGRAVTTPGGRRWVFSARVTLPEALRGRAPAGGPVPSRPARGTPSGDQHLPRRSREASCGRRVRMAAGARGGGRPYLPPRSAAGRRLPGQASRRARRHKGKAAGPARGGAKAGGGIAPAAGRPPRLPPLPAAPLRSPPLRSAPPAPGGEAGGKGEIVSSEARKKNTPKHGEGRRGWGWRREATTKRPHPEKL